MKMANWGKIGICIAGLTLVLSSGPALARIRTLQISELIARSDIIVIGRIAEKRKTAEVPKGGVSTEETIENVVVPTRVLKGKWSQGKPMSFTTWRSVRNGKKLRQEDALSFPESGSEALLFIRWSQGKPQIVNGIQGIWPIGKDGKLLGMGSRYTLEEVRREIGKTSGTGGER